MNLHPRNTKRNAERVVDPLLDQLGRALGLELGSRIIRMTPVDTGRAQCNWNTSVGEPEATVTDQAVKGGGPALNRLAGTVADLKIADGDTMYLTNGLPYIEPLNEGTSVQAPEKWIEQATGQVQKMVPRVAKRVRRG